MGQPISQVVRAFNVPITVTRPDGEETALRPAETKQFSRVFYEKTDRAGIYELKLGTPINRTEWYAVNVNPLEGKLSYVGRKELESDLLPGVKFQHLTRWEDGPQVADSAQTERGGLTRWLLMAVFALVMVELLMAWRFRWGFGLLCLIVLAVMVRQFFVLNALLTGLALAAALVVAGVLALRSRRRLQPASPLEGGLP